MSFRFLLVVNTAGGLVVDAVTQWDAGLRDAGMRRQLASRALVLFVAEQTPTMLLPNGGALLGHAFSKDGSRIDDARRFPSFEDAAQTRAHLMKHCWGPYLLVQPDDEHGGITVMREPSPHSDVACFYTLRDGKGFATSDISLPERLGLYRRQVDWDAIRHRLAFPQLKTAHTALAGVHELLPGSALHLKEDHATTRLLWSPWEFVTREARHRDSDEAAADVRSAVSTATKALAGIDRSILLELSGGLDSSIVGVCLRGASTPTVCTSLVTTVPGADERTYAVQIADQLGVELHTGTLHLDSARFDFGVHPQCMTPRVGVLQHAVDEVMLAAAARHGTESFFSGGGGDTIFCALDTAAPAADAIRERGPFAGMAAVRDLATLHQCTLLKAGRLTLRKMRRARYVDRAPDGLFLAPGISVPPTEAHPWSTAPQNALPGDRERIRSLATCQAYRDSLARGESLTMRMPLLAQPAVEACLRTPSWMWIAGGRNRAIARMAFADLLPPDILHRRSKGTFMSYLGAVYRRNRGPMRDFLLQGRLQQEDLLDTKAIAEFMRHDIPEGGHAFTRVFDLCIVENWVRHQP
ncbi:asparagine synthase C-terminal domain-containing protein [Luteimonas terrae]|uniref:asparagine synthase (glutamine-hydrolyzing) n=1 Tax=Luteimonas terrae TaxID=1530191 RepID=A0ABU1XYI7_9GAMM|nr:asparagine synthase C-terminal domain-containing protein [Luteimonas terrae]MDR7193280.1 asparagine synthase (glutamine-hydrolyzing) [Luteimonas terrae]